MMTEKEIEKCSNCKGTGVDPNSYDEHIMCGNFHGWWRKCPKCKGTGGNTIETGEQI